MTIFGKVQPAPTLRTILDKPEGRVAAVLFIEATEAWLCGVGSRTKVAGLLQELWSSIDAPEIPWDPKEEDVDA